mgnify:CR=1 FL=1
MKTLLESLLEQIEEEFSDDRQMLEALPLDLPGRGRQQMLTYLVDEQL